MYELGCGIAFIFWCWSLINTLVTIHSQAERNLRKVGLRHSWASNKPKDVSKSYQQRGVVMHVAKFILLEISALVCVFLSWIQVAFVLGTVLYAFAKDTGAPREIREFRWKMRNRDLSFDEIVAGLSLSLGKDISTQGLGEQIREEMRDRGIV